MAKEENIKIANSMLITNSKGITLVALVVTVVILLILAGITISFAFGENGIIKKAGDARNKTEEGVEKSEQLMQNLEDKLNEYTGSGSGGSGGSGTGDGEDKVYDITSETEKPFETTNHETIKVKDSTGKNIITLPKGFRIKTSESTSVKDGIVISDSSDDSVQGNEFVWIPVGKVYRSNSETDFADIKLGRYTFKREENSETGVYEDGTPTLVQEAYTEENPTNYTNMVVIDYFFGEYATRENPDGMETVYGDGFFFPGENAIAKDLAGFVDSVKNNGGYYLARYEASYGGGYKADGANDTAKYENAKPLSQPSENKSDVMNYTPKTLWNNITQINASKVCRNMYSDTDITKGVKSDLVNSYAWDTAIVYIQKMGTTNYANKKDGNGTLKNTGEPNDEVCKINDMGSNLLEWTTEHFNGANSSGSYPSVARGGKFENAYYYTARRGYHELLLGSLSSIGFRPLLYIK